MRRLTMAVLGLGGMVLGCGGSSSGSTTAGDTTTTSTTTGSGGGSAGGAGQGGAPTTTTTTTTGSSTGGGGATSAGGAGQGGAAAGLVVNEIAAAGADWVELGNAGSTTLDLGDYALCDTDANGGCKVAEAVRFPKGTLLAAKEHVLVVCNKDADAGVGPGTDCVAGGPATCFYATWKVSSKNGEGLFVLDANDAVLSETKYPANAVADGQTWGRLPDLTGAFGAGSPTPGAPNAAP